MTTPETPIALAKRTLELSETFPGMGAPAAPILAAAVVDQAHKLDVAVEALEGIACALEDALTREDCHYIAVEALHALGAGQEARDA